MIGFEKNTTLFESVPRDSLMWLFAVQLFVLAPHFLTVPGWILLVWLVVVFWRWKIFQGAWGYPSKLHKAVVVLLCTAGLLLSLGINFSLLTMVSLLLVGFSLKQLEMKHKKDFMLLLYLALFILATQFIFFNQLLAAVYGFGCMVLIFATFMQLHNTPSQQSFNKTKDIWKALRSSSLVLVQAIPFVIILFVAMPRLGSFWSVPSPQHAKTGMSDSMSPGDLSELIKSDELVFRATFAGNIPTNDKLYWRSLVFSYFDGRRWSQSRLKPIRQSFPAQDYQTSSQPISGWRKKIEYLGDRITYDIIVEPSGQPWLYALTAPEIWSNDLLMARDLHIQSATALAERTSYKVTSALDYRMEAAEQDSEMLNLNLQLPDSVNPETRKRAGEWLAETGSADKLIEKLFAYYHKSFFYTLRPPSLGGDTVDEFLWQSRQGFCEHFAGSFVFFMRAAGVPARVVVGYQGGELNRVESYLSVRQRDAHAWAEVWLQGRGWVLFDPTSAVAPERIRSGIVESLSATDQAFLYQPFGASLKLIMALRNRFDALNYQWTRWIMNYDSTSQAALLGKLLQDVSPMRVAVLVLSAGCITSLGIFMVLFFRTQHKKLSVQERAAQWVYRKLCKKLKRVDVVPTLGETPRDLVMRAVAQQPKAAPSLYSIINLYEQLVYAENLTVFIQLKRELAAIDKSLYG